MATNYDDDPLAVESAPSLSFKDAPVNTMHYGTIVKRPRLVQSRNFDDGTPKTWPDGNPVMSVVILLEVGGELRSLWAQKPSAMFAALVQAQKLAGGEPMQEGGTLYVKFVGEEPNKKNVKLNPQKLYACKYVPPTPAPGGPADPFGDVPAPTPPAKPTPTPASVARQAPRTAAPEPF